LASVTQAAPRAVQSASITTCSVPQPVAALHVGSKVRRCAFVHESAGSGHWLVIVVLPQPPVVLHVPVTRVKLRLPAAQLEESRVPQLSLVGVALPHDSALGLQVALARLVKTRLLQLAGMCAQTREACAASPHDIVFPQAGV
jgi:hypothetical protein